MTDSAISCINHCQNEGECAFVRSPADSGAPRTRRGTTAIASYWRHTLSEKERERAGSRQPGGVSGSSGIGQSKAFGHGPRLSLHLVGESSFPDALHCLLLKAKHLPLDATT